MKGEGTITRVVNGIVDGRPPTDADPTLHRIYSELRSLASARLARDRAATIQPTDLVHEAFLKLFRPGQPPWQSRAHFFGAAGRAMQQLLVDHSRRRRRRPRAIDGLDVPAPGADVDVAEFVEALRALERHDPGFAQIVNLRVFAGLTVPEAAEALGISERTLKRHDSVARTWLHGYMTGGRDGAPREAAP